MAKVLTVKAIAALKPAPAGKRYDRPDGDAHGMFVRVTDKGKKTYVLIGRIPGSKYPTRLKLGDVGGKLTLEEARLKARSWITLIKQGTDPRKEEKRQEQLKKDALQAEADKEGHTFKAVAELYLENYVKGQRTAAATRRIFDKELIPILGKRPMAEIERDDVEELLEAIKARGLRMAMIVRQHISRLYVWAIHTKPNGLRLKSNPTTLIKPEFMFGERKFRTRVLEDDELRAFWRATERMGYPFGAIFRMLILTGARRDEVGGASWTELSEDMSTLTVPEERFKSGTPHLVPISGDARAVLEGLPVATRRGSFIFSFTFGRTPVKSYGRAKLRLDALMAEELGHQVKPWVLHDLRRTVRTRLSPLTTYEVAEMVVGHGKRGLQRVYDQHTYADEMRQALEAWAARLRSIVTPPPANVVPLREHHA
jgi:integrase